MNNQILNEILENQKLMFNEFKEFKSEQQKTNQRLDNLEQGQKDLTSKVSNLDTKVSNLDTKVSNLDTKVSNLETKVSNLEQGQKILKSEVSQIKYTLKAVFDQTVNLTEFQTETNMNFDEIKKVIKNHSYRIDKLESIS